MRTVFIIIVTMNAAAAVVAVEIVELGMVEVEVAVAEAFGCECGMLVVQSWVLGVRKRRSVGGPVGEQVLGTDVVLVSQEACLPAVYVGQCWTSGVQMRWKVESALER